MLIPFKDICEKYKIAPKGVIHVGAHHGEEIQDYYSDVASDLSSYSGVNITMTKSGETTAKIDAQPMSIVNASIGRYKYEFLATDVNSSGTFYIEFELVNASGKTQTVYEQKTMTIRDSLN